LVSVAVVAVVIAAIPAGGPLGGPPPPAPPGGGGSAWGKSPPFQGGPRPQPDVWVRFFPRLDKPTRGRTAPPGGLRPTHRILWAVPHSAAVPPALRPLAGTGRRGAILAEEPGFPGGVHATEQPLCLGRGHRRAGSGGVRHELRHVQRKGPHCTL